MASGGAGGGGGGAAAPAKGDSLAVAGRLRAIAEGTGLYGDFVLAGIDPYNPFPIELLRRGYYFRSGHGEETRMNHLGRHPTSTVPPGCAYMTNVACGDVVDFGVEDKTTMNVFSGKRRPLSKLKSPVSIKEASSKLIALLDGCIGGDEAAIEESKELFTVKRSETSEVEIVPAGGTFTTSHFLPYFTYKEGPAGSERYVAMPSGLLPLGAPIDIGMAFTHYTEEVLRFMYQHSVFPTFEMVMASGVRGFLYEEEEAELAEGNRDSVEGHLRLLFRCSSEALMLRFPGFHAHAVCRSPIASEIYRHEERPRKAKEMGKLRAASLAWKGSMDFYPLITRYVASCEWGGEGEPEKPADLSHPDTWDNKQRSHAMEHGQWQHIREMRGAGKRRGTRRRKQRRQQRQQRQTRRKPQRVGSAR